MVMMTSVSVTEPCRQLLLLLFLLAVAMDAYVIQIVEYTPKAVSCWSCPDKNDATCEQSKENHLCPFNFTMCRIVHHVDMVTGQSVVKSRTCAHQSQCTKDKVGCNHTQISRIKECISCCNNAHCKDNISRNASAAWMYSIKKSSAPSINISPQSNSIAMLISAIISFTVLYSLP